MLVKFMVHSLLKERVKLLEHQLEASEEKQKLLAEKSRHLEEAKVKLHGSLSSKDVALTSELEELRAKVGQMFICTLLHYIQCPCISAPQSGVRKRPVTAHYRDDQGTSQGRTSSYGEISQVRIFRKTQLLPTLFVLTLSTRIQAIEESFHRRETKSVVLFCVMLS